MTCAGTSQSVCNFGFAVGDITPPAGIYHRMWGAATHDRAEGVHRPLRASVAIFRSCEAGVAGSRQVLVALDHCLLGPPEITLLLNELTTTTNVTPEEVIFVFSHTHAAGLMSLDRKDLPGGELIQPYLQMVAERVSKLILEAQQNSAEATIVYGVGRCDLAQHRDFWDEERKQFVCGYNPQGAADDTVLVARITGTDGEWRASLVNYACHPTTLAWENRLVSPDFPGAMRELIEEATGAPCLFLQGASAELGPKEGYVGDVSVADRNGRQLGYAALSALTALPPPCTEFKYTGPVISGATLGAWEHVPLTEPQRAEARHWQRVRWTLPLDYRPSLPTLERVQAELAQWQERESTALADGDAEQARDCRAMVERQTRMVARLAWLPRGDTFPLDLCLWRLGNSYWLAIPGEPYSALQTSLRRRFPDMAIVVANLANGWGPSYLPTADVYDRGIYQESIAVVAAGSLERIIDDVARQIERMRQA